MTYPGGTILRRVELVRDPEGRLHRQTGRVAGTMAGTWTLIRTPQAGPARTAQDPQEVA